MPLICVEGIDFCGKTTIVKQLASDSEFNSRQKKRRIGTISFPQNREILKIDYDKTDPDAIEGHHKMFLKDFQETQSKLKGMLKEYDLVVADRYTGSYVSYYVYDIFYQKAVVSRMNQFDLIDYLDSVCEKKVKEVNELIKPDLTLLIYNYDENLDRLDAVKQSMFSTSLTMLNQKYEVIEALKRDTFKQVLDILKEKKYIIEDSSIIK